MGFLELSDDVLIVILARIPWCTHGAVKGCSRRLRAIVQSSAFIAERRESGSFEHGVVVAGGSTSYPTFACSLWIGGRWRRMPSMMRARPAFD